MYIYTYAAWTVWEKNMRCNRMDIGMFYRTTFHCHYIRSVFPILPPKLFRYIGTYMLSSTSFSFFSIALTCLSLFHFLFFNPTISTVYCVIISTIIDPYHCSSNNFDSIFPNNRWIYVFLLPKIIIISKICMKNSLIKR